VCVSVLSFLHFCFVLCSLYLPITFLGIHDSSGSLQVQLMSHNFRKFLTFFIIIIIILFFCKRILLKIFEFYVVFKGIFEFHVIIFLYVLSQKSIHILRLEYLGLYILKIEGLLVYHLFHVCMILV
jgi:hypothetical protein